MNHQQRVLDLASTAVSVFEPLVDQLMAVRGSVGALNKSVERFADVAGGDAARETGGSDLSASTVHLQDRIDAVTQQLQDVSLQRSGQRVMLLSQNLIQSSKELRAISSFTLIVTAPLKSHEFDGDSFVMDARLMSTRIEDAVTRIDRTCVDLLSHESEVTGTLATARRTVEACLATAEAGPALDDAGAEADEAGQVLSTTRALSTDIANQMRAMVACMQHPDAFSQRAGHVAGILKHASHGASDDATALRILAAMQMEDMADRLETVVLDAGNALAYMSQRGEDTSSELVRQIDAPARIARLEESRDRVSSTAATLSGIYGEIQEALDDLAKMREKLDEMQAVFSTLESAREAVQLSALNAGITAHRLGSVAAGMPVVANATRDVAGACANTIGLMADIMTTISDATDVLDVANLHAAFVKTGQDIEMTEAFMKSLVTRAGEVAGAASGVESAITALTTSAKDAHQRLSDLNANIVSARAVASELDSAIRSEGTLSPELETILSLIEAEYSMHEERDVHSAFLSRMGFDSDKGDRSDDASAAAVAAAAEPDLADILF